MAHNFKSSTSTTAKYSTTTITSKSTTNSRSTTKPTTNSNKIDHGQKHRKIVTSSSAPKAQTSQGTHHHHHHHQVHHHHHHHHHHHQQISKPKAPERALTQPKPKLAMAHATATIKSTTTKATIKLGHGVEFKVVTKETELKGGKIAYIK